MSREFSEALFDSNGFIVVSNDFEYAQRIIRATFKGEILIFPKPYKEQQDMLVEDVEELLEAAYLTGENRLFVLKSGSYSQVVQNRLLKLLEEPPRGVKFVVMVESKAALLPTVRSRLLLCEIKNKQEHAFEIIDLSRLKPAMLFDMLKKTESMNKDDAKEYLYALLDAYKRVQNPKEPQKNSEKLELFDKAFRLLSLNTPPKAVFATLFTKLAAK
ncbi:MAG: hypothetical protein PHE67_08195 [Campylobacterales bacterium]|nr:hypothetical protein [Campylobacterales bacterium]